jgi:Tannase-like family of unknown function (DUF6351)
LREPGLDHEFGPSCGTVHSQASPENVLDEMALSRGLMVAGSSMNVLGNNCNTVTSAEAVVMLKQRIIDRYGSTGGCPAVAAAGNGEFEIAYLMSLSKQRLRAGPELGHAVDPALGVLRLTDDELVHLGVRQDQEAVLREAIEDSIRGPFGRDHPAAADRGARLSGVATGSGSEHRRVDRSRADT